MGIRGRLYQVADGKRIQLATREELTAPAGEWHTITVRMKGSEIVCLFDVRYNSKPGMTRSTRRVRSVFGRRPMPRPTSMTSRPRKCRSKGETPHALQRDGRLATSN